MKKPCLITNKFKRIILSSVMIIALVLNMLPMSLFSNEADLKAHATSLANVQILSDIEINANLEDRANPYELELQMRGTGLADVELINPERVGIFYIPELAGKMESNGQAEVRVEILPITLDDLPALKVAVGNLTGTATTLVGGVVDALDQILGKNPLLKPFVSIEGLDEVNTAIDNLNKLDESLADLLAYEDQINVVILPNGAITVDFSDGLGNHLDTAVNDLVTELVNDLLNAVGNLEIRVLDDFSDIPGLGPVLVGVVNDLILGGIVSELLGGITGGLQPVITEVTKATTNITTQLAGLQVIGETLIKANIFVDKPSGVTGEIPVYGAGVQTSVINLPLLSSLTDKTTITFNEKQSEKPTVDDVFVGETELKGTGKPGATIRVEDGNETRSTIVNSDGSYHVSGFPPFVLDQKIKVYQLEEGHNYFESEPVTVTVKEKSLEQLDPPHVNEAYEGETSLTGTGKAGATIHVKGKDGSIVATTKVGEDGKFTVSNLKSFKKGDTFKVHQEKEGYKPSKAVSVEVKAKKQEQLPKPTIKDAYAGDEIVTGTGTPGATIQVKDRQGNKLGTAIVNDKGSYSVAVNLLSEGDELVVTQTKKGYLESEPATMIVKALGLEQLDPPGVHTVYEDTTKVSGTGTPGATVVVKDEENNELGTITVDENGNYEVEVDQPFTAGDNLYVTQTKQGFTDSEATRVTVQANDLMKSKPPLVHDVYENETDIKGTGEPGATIYVKLAGSSEVKTTEVDGDGNYTVTGFDPFEVGQELTVTQKEVGDNIEVSDPVKVIVKKEDLEKGELKFLSAPKLLQFTAEIKSYQDEYLVDLDKLEQGLVIRDDRPTKVGWELRAKMNKQLTSKDDPNIKMEDALIYREDKNEPIILNEEDRIIKEHKYEANTNPVEEFNLSSKWGTDGNGLFLEVPVGTKKENYEGQVNWTLSDAP